MKQDGTIFLAAAALDSKDAAGDRRNVGETGCLLRDTVIATNAVTFHLMVPHSAR